MPIANLNDIELSYCDEGQSRNQDQDQRNEKPVLLIHGFASTKHMNWIGPGWVKALRDAGYRVIAFDNRGHGESSKFHNNSDYSLEKMADDALQLIEHLGLEQPHLIGYSMGARIAMRLALDHGGQFDRIILGGNGYGIIEGTGSWDPVRDALLADSLEDVTDERGRAFRIFAEQTKSDRKALAACVTSVRQLFTEEEVRSIENEVLVAIGTKDDIAGSGEKLAALMPNGEYLPIPNRDHMRAVGDKVFIEGGLAFLGR